MPPEGRWVLFAFAALCSCATSATEHSSTAPGGLAVRDTLLVAAGQEAQGLGVANATAGRSLRAVPLGRPPCWRGRFDTKNNLGYFAPQLKLDSRYTWLASSTSTLLQFIRDPTIGPSRQPVLKAIFPQGSWAPQGSPNGGTLFYAYPFGEGVPIAYTGATLEYDVYFPADFEFVKGGKLPGLAGGHTGCGGGADATYCWSVRVMWRRQGAGEAYLYLPGIDKGWQAADLCSQPPYTICDPTAGTSLSRGAFSFTLGAWHKIALTVELNEVLNTTTGSVQVVVNDQIVISYNTINYRAFSGINVDSVYYALWYGGSDATWGPSKQTSLLLKNHRITSLDPTNLKRANVSPVPQSVATRQQVAIVDTGEPQD